MNNLIQSAEAYPKILFNDIYKNEQRQRETISTLQMFHETMMNIQKYITEINFDVLCPLTRKAKVRGKLEHTNEVLVAIGCDYFIKMTIPSSTEYLKRRLKVFEDYLSQLRVERTMLQQRVNFGLPIDENSFEITEKYEVKTEEEWRKQHKNNVIKYLKEERLKRKNDTKDYIKILEELEKVEDFTSNFNSEVKTDPVPINHFDDKRFDNPNQDVIDYLDLLDIKEMVSDILDTVVHKVTQSIDR